MSECTFDWCCLLCGALFDGYLHIKPESCPNCGGPDNLITSAQEQDDIEDENRRINTHDEYLEDIL